MQICQLSGRRKVSLEEKSFSRLSLSHFGSHGLFPSHDSHQSSGIGVPFSSSNFSGASSGPQLLFCPTSATPSAFYSVESDPRQSNNNVQIFSSRVICDCKLPISSKGSFMALLYDKLYSMVVNVGL